MFAIKKNHETYIAFSWKLIFSIFDMINDNAVRCGTMQNKNIKIFEQLKFIKSFFKRTILSAKCAWKNETFDKSHWWQNITFEFYLQYVAKWTRSDMKLFE